MSRETISGLFAVAVNKALANLLKYSLPQEDIRAGLLAVEREAKGLLEEILGGKS